MPLSYREDRYDAHVEKEPFCLFVGTMTQERKNVGRLIAAAKKFGFRLVLAGSPGNAASENHLRAQIADASNIDLKGFVSDDELYSLYNRAKVFALPSLNEGPLKPPYMAATSSSLVWAARRSITEKTPYGW